MDLDLVNSAGSDHKSYVAMVSNTYMLESKVSINAGQNWTFL